jgi:hypothetical protein
MPPMSPPSTYRDAKASVRFAGTSNRILRAGSGSCVVVIGRSTGSGRLIPQPSNSPRARGDVRWRGTTPIGSWVKDTEEEIDLGL